MKQPTAHRSPRNQRISTTLMSHVHSSPGQDKIVCTASDENKGEFKNLLSKMNISLAGQRGQLAEITLTF